MEGTEKRHPVRLANETKIGHALKFSTVFFLVIRGENRLASDPSEGKYFVVFT